MMVKAISQHRQTFVYSTLCTQSLTFNFGSACEILDWPSYIYSSASDHFIKCLMNVIIYDESDTCS